MDSAREKPPSKQDITDDDLQFLSKYLGVTDLEQLRDHVFKIWTECTASVWAYRCIRGLAFLKPRMIRHFFYSEALQLGTTNPQARFLDLGCCFGTDTRKLILDGWNKSNLEAVDVVNDYWNFGLNLFKDQHTLAVKVRMILDIAY